MSEAESTTQTEAEQAENEVAISELRAQDALAEHEYVSASLSYVNEAGSPYAVVRVKVVLPTLEATETEWEDTRYKVSEVSVKGEVGQTKKAIADMTRGAERHDVRFEQVDTVEEQPRPGVAKEEFPVYRMVVLYDDENGRHDTPDE